MGTLVTKHSTWVSANPWRTTGLMVVQSLFLPKPKIRIIQERHATGKHETKQIERSSSFLAPVSSLYIKVFFFIFLLLALTHLSLQMTESYASSGNGYANASSPSLGPSVPPTGVPPVIRKKLMGYVGFANLPNQVHRKSVRKGFQFTAMVVGSCFSAAVDIRNPDFSAFLGESGLGKSTLINTMFNTTLYPPKRVLPPAAERPKTVAIESIGAGTVSRTMILRYTKQVLVDIEENGVRLHLTVVDTPGFGDFVNNDDRHVFVSSHSKYRH
jgi:hypothetical protein